MNETLEKAEKLLEGQIEDLEHQLELFNEYIRGHEALVKQLFGVDSGSSEEISMNSTISPFIFEIKKNVVRHPKISKESFHMVCH